MSGRPSSGERLLREFAAVINGDGRLVAGVVVCAAVAYLGVCRVVLRRPAQRTALVRVLCVFRDGAWWYVWADGIGPIAKVGQERDAIEQITGRLVELDGEVAAK